MNALNAENVRRKALDIYAYIRDHLYLNRPDMAVNDEEFNSALLMSLLVMLQKLEMFKKWRNQERISASSLFTKMSIH